MNNATITQALIQQCNEAILFAKRRDTTAMQLLAEEVLTTCSNIADHCGLIDLNALILSAKQQLENGNPQTIAYGQQPPMGDWPVTTIRKLPPDEKTGGL